MDFLRVRPIQTPRKSDVCFYGHNNLARLAGVVLSQGKFLHILNTVSYRSDLGSVQLRFTRIFTAVRADGANQNLHVAVLWIADTSVWEGCSLSPQALKQTS